MLKRMIKRVIVVVLAAIMALGTPALDVDASNPNDNDKDSFIESSYNNITIVFDPNNFELGSPQYLELRQSLTYQTSRNQRNATNNEVRLVQSGVHEGNSGYRRAPGLPPGGHRLPTAGSGLFWTPGGSRFSFSISVGWGPVSVSVDLGNASTGSIGTFVAVPANLVGHFCALYINQRVRVTTFRMYTRPLANPNAPWTFVQNTTSQSLIWRAFQIRRA